MTRRDDEWGRPIDLMADSDAPEQIALELGRRHALYLREAQRLVLEALVPTRRAHRRHPGGDPPLPRLTPVARARLARAGGYGRRGEHALGAAGDRRDGRRRPAAAPTGGAPIRRLALQPSATIVGNMAVRKQPTEQVSSSPGMRRRK